jgi:hypothetical protein
MVVIMASRLALVRIMNWVPSFISCVTITLVAVLFAGCTTTYGRTYIGGEWPTARLHLGRLAVLPPRVGPGTEEAAETRAAEAQTVAEASLRGQPGVEIVDAAPLIAALDNPSLETPLSDHELVVAARKVGIDTICLLTLAEYGGCFGMLFIPPLWKSETSVSYGLRLVDARSGKLLLETIRLRSTGGLFAIRGRGDLPAELAGDLATVFSAADPPTPVRVTASVALPDAAMARKASNP